MKFVQNLTEQNQFSKHKYEVLAQIIICGFSKLFLFFHIKMNFSMLLVYDFIEPITYFYNSEANNNFLMFNEVYEILPRTNASTS